MEKERPGVVAEAFGEVLEIGFGSGLNIPYYKNVTKLYAVDPSEELYGLSLALVKGAPFPVEYIAASAEEIPLPKETVDAVVSTWSLCSIPHPEVALKEIYRLLKPKGKFLFIEHGKSPREGLATWQNRLTPLSKACLGGCHLNREIDTLIQQAGFKIIKVEKFPLPSKPLAFMYKGVAVKVV